MYAVLLMPEDINIGKQNVEIDHVETRNSFNLKCCKWTINNTFSLYMCNEMSKVFQKDAVFSVLVFACFLKCVLTIYRLRIPCSIFLWVFNFFLNIQFNNDGVFCYNSFFYFKLSIQFYPKRSFCLQLVQLCYVFQKCYWTLNFIK